MKRCNICKQEKSFDGFNKFIRSKDGYRGDCRDCQSIKRKEYDIKYKTENIEKVRESNKKYKIKNRDKINKESLEYYYNNKERDKEKKSKYWKKHRSKNKEKVTKYQKEYYSKNKKKLSILKIKYRKDNKEKIKKYNSEYTSNRIKNDPIFKISHHIRSSIRKSLINKGFAKRSRTCDILGCSFVEFRLYIESKFEPWMTWENYGKYNGELNHGWDIDHIIPLSSVKSEDEIIKLNHYTNLQPYEKI